MLTWRLLFASSLSTGQSQWVIRALRSQPSDILYPDRCPRLRLQRVRLWTGRGGTGVIEGYKWTASAVLEVPLCECGRPREELSANFEPNLRRICGQTDS